MLICPNCGKNLIDDKKSFICDNGHCFDKAKQGYVNLLLANAKNSSSPGDNEEMTGARRNFLNGGYYSPLCKQICSAIHRHTNGSILDACCAEGYYTSKFPHEYDVFGFDLSKNAIKLASAFDKRTTYFIASAFSIPIKSQSISVVTRIFAPDANSEFLRVLKKDGVLIDVVPDEEHLLELKKLLYTDVYLNKVEQPKREGFELIDQLNLKYEFCPTVDDRLNLFKMTPYFYRTKKRSIENLHSAPTGNITAHFSIRIYKKL